MDLQKHHVKVGGCVYSIQYLASTTTPPCFARLCILFVYWWAL